MIRQDDELTSAVDMEPMTMIDPPMLEPSDLKAALSACEWFITPTLRRFQTMFIGLPFLLPKSTPTNGRVTTTSFAFTQPSVMAMVSGQETTTVTEFVRFILTHVKVCGRRFAISDVPFEASTRNTSRVTLLSANSVSISNASIPISSRTWSQEETTIEPTVFP